MTYFGNFIKFFIEFMVCSLVVSFVERHLVWDLNVSRWFAVKHINEQRKVLRVMIIIGIEVMCILIIFRFVDGKLVDF